MMEQNKKAVTLKRTVTIKAIVTEDFKKYLIYELENSIRSLNQKIKQIEMQGNQLVETLSKQGALDQTTTIRQQMELERQQHQMATDELKNRITEAQNLALNSEFIQGTIDGYVTIKVGDNLYQKLGGMEIIIKDGIVQNIIGDVDSK